MMEEGRFKWIFGETVQPIPWYPGQPNGGNGQNCLAMNKDMGQSFYDVTCSNKLEFLCQITI